jgi:hypothetical protein
MADYLPVAPGNSVADIQSNTTLTLPLFFAWYSARSAEVIRNL